MLATAPLALTDVVLSFEALGDFSGGLTESLAVYLNGTLIDHVFDSDATDCPEVPDVDELLLSANTFNDAVAGGDAVIDLLSTRWVAPDNCAAPV